MIGDEKSEAAKKAEATQAARAGIWLGIAAIVMAFAALTSAIIVRQGSDPDWQHVQLPGMVYFNTVVILLSSLTLEMARRKPGEAPESGLRWLQATLSLGMLFVLGQAFAWWQLAGRGVFLASNPSSSFFYVLTGIHGLHLVGGIVALAYVVARLAGKARVVSGSLFEAVTIYWHFMGGLWVYLLIVIRTRL
ncbi:MAG: cytochrome c oxidase subunit 3 [Acidobacteriia bacterium]|nr:cytochrome c oxidase subunit 3 [Terriglobia bacterium]